MSVFFTPKQGRNFYIKILYVRRHLSFLGRAEQHVDLSP